MVSKFTKYVCIFVKLAMFVGTSILGLCLLFALFYYFDNRLFLWQARWIWPQRAFIAEEFKRSNPTQQATMVVDIIKSKRFIGKSMSVVQKELGPPTGDYYHNEVHYTYRLTERKKTNWTLTFLSDGSGAVESVFIRKSGYSISKKILYAGIDLIPKPKIKRPKQVSKD